MNLRTLPYTITMMSLLREILFSSTRMVEDPLAANLAPRFDALREEWKTVLLEEIDILTELTGAEARATRIDSVIDLFATKVSRTTDDNSTGETRKRLRTALFKNKPLSKFTRPVLKQQLTSMSDWGGVLGSSNISALQALVAEHDGLMIQAEAAGDQVLTAQQRNREFRLIGRRKQFIDKVNAERREAAGALGKLEAERPDVPSGYAESFFSHEMTREDEPTQDEVAALIASLEAQLVEQKDLLKRLQDEAEAERKAAEERKAQQAEADQLEAEAKALLEKAAELKKRAQKK